MTVFALGASFLLFACDDGAKEADQTDNGGASSPEKMVEDTAEKLVADTNDFMTKVTGVIKEVNEGADPDKAAEKLKEWEGEAQKLSERMKTIVEEDYEGSKEAFNEKMSEFYEGEMGQAAQEYTAEMMKLAQEGEEEAEGFLQELKRVMSELNN